MKTCLKHPKIWLVRRPFQIPDMAARSSTSIATWLANRVKAERLFDFEPSASPAAARRQPNIES